VEIVGQILRVYSFIILGRVLMSWIPMFTQRPLNYSNPLVKVLMDVTEPVLAPLRRYLMIGQMDLSPIVVLITLNVIAGALIES
jgi:uncharacterized protein YggT (Ycf19 family)